MTGLNIDYEIGYITWGDLQKNHPIFYYFFALRSLNTKKDNFESVCFRNIHGFTSCIINKKNNMIDSVAFNEFRSQEGGNFWRKFFCGTMTNDDKKQLYKLILNEVNNEQTIE